MTDYVRQHDAPRFPFEREETERLKAQFESDATVTDGIVRWNANGGVLPADVLVFWAHLGKPFDAEASERVRKAEQDVFIARYREQQKDHVPDAEELHEMRAAFGPGETVVNVITGRRLRL